MSQRVHRMPGFSNATLRIVPTPGHAPEPRAGVRDQHSMGVASDEPNFANVAVWLAGDALQGLECLTANRFQLFHRTRGVLRRPAGGENDKLLPPRPCWNIDVGPVSQHAARSPAFENRTEVSGDAVPLADQESLVELAPCVRRRGRGCPANRAGVAFDRLPESRRRRPDVKAAAERDALSAGRANHEVGRAPAAVPRNNRPYFEPAHDLATPLGRSTVQRVDRDGHVGGIALNGSNEVCSNRHRTTQDCRMPTFRAQQDSDAIRRFDYVAAASQ